MTKNKQTNEQKHLDFTANYSLKKKKKFVCFFVFLGEEYGTNDLRLKSKNKCQPTFDKLKWWLMYAADLDPNPDIWTWFPGLTLVLPHHYGLLQQTIPGWIWLLSQICPAQLAWVLQDCALGHCSRLPCQHLFLQVLLNSLPLWLPGIASTQQAKACDLKVTLNLVIVNWLESEEKNIQHWQTIITIKYLQKCPSM